MLLTIVLGCSFVYNLLFYVSVQFSSVQSLSHVRLFATAWISACQASLSIINSRSVLKHMSIESVMPSSHLRSAWKFFFLISRLHSLLQFDPDDQYKCGVLNLRMLQFPDSEMLNGALLSENWPSTSLGILVIDYHLRDSHFEQPRRLFKYTSSYPLWLFTSVSNYVAIKYTIKSWGKLWTEMY